MSDVAHVELDECTTESAVMLEEDVDEEMMEEGEGEGEGGLMMVICLCAFSSLGGILFGYDTGINGGVQVSIKYHRDSSLEDLRRQVS